MLFSIPKLIEFLILHFFGDFLHHTFPDFEFPYKIIRHNRPELYIKNERKSSEYESNKIVYHRSHAPLTKLNFVPIYYFLLYHIPPEKTTL